MADSNSPNPRAETPTGTEGAEPSHAEPSHAERSFAEQAQQADPGILAEFWDFLIHNKKWWLTPIIVVLLLFGVLIMLSGTAVAPFIYTLW